MFPAHAILLSQAGKPSVVNTIRNTANQYQIPYWEKAAFLRDMDDFVQDTITHIAALKKFRAEQDSR